MRKEEFNVLKDKIKDIQFAMLTTVEQDEDLRSRPMATHDMDDDGTIWFLIIAIAYLILYRAKQREEEYL